MLPIPPTRAGLARLATIALLTACGGSEHPTEPPATVPAPQIGTLATDSVPVGAAGTAFAVTGSGFQSISVVRWNGDPRPTRYVSATQLTATLTAADVATVGPAQVSVYTPPPGGGTSADVRVTVHALVPVTSTITPARVVAGSADSVFTITGAGFLATTRAFVGDSARPTAVESPDVLRVTLGAADRAAGGVVAVRVVTPPPGGGTATATVAVDNPVPDGLVLETPTADAGQPGMAARIRGAYFPAGTRVLVGRVGGPAPIERAVTRASPSALTVALTAGDVAAPGPVALRVMVPAPGGGEATVTVQVAYAVPVITSLAYEAMDVGTSSRYFSVSGRGFARGSVVYIDGVARETSTGTDSDDGTTVLSVTLAPADMDHAAVHTVTVVNPSPGGGTSNAKTFTVRVEPPHVFEMSSYGATAGSAGFTLVLDGYAFCPDTRVTWGGAPRPTTVVGTTRLTVALSAADVATPGAPRLEVVTPGAASTWGTWFAVLARPRGGIDRVLDIDVPAADIVFNPHTNRLYASVPAGAPRYANSVIAIDLERGGVVVDSLVVGADPGALAVTRDGTALFVALDGTGEVRRLAVAPRLATAGPAVPLGGGVAEDMVVGASAPRLFVSRMTTGGSPRHLGVTLFDDGGRLTDLPAATRGNSLAAGPVYATVYAYDNEGPAFGVRPLLEYNGGASAGDAHAGLMGTRDARIVLAGGRLYASSGEVVDATRWERVLTLPVASPRAGASLAVELGRGRAYALSADGTLRAFDVNTGELLGSASIPGTAAEPDEVGRRRFRLLRLTSAAVFGYSTSALAFRDGRRIRIVITPLAYF